MVFLLLRMDSVFIYMFLKQGAGYVYAMPSASISISPENSSFLRGNLAFYLMHKSVPLQEQVKGCPSLLGYPVQATGR